HVPAELTAPQPAGVEPAPGGAVAQTDGIVGIGVPDHHLVLVRRIGGLATGATDARRQAREHLLPFLVHAEELRAEEGADRFANHDALRVLVRLALATHAAGGNELPSRVAKARHLVALHREHDAAEERPR